MPDHDLRRATLQGVRWISAARLLAEATALAASIVLARLLVPAEFGRAAIALIVVGLAAILGPAGLTAVLVQRPDLERAHIDAARVISVLAGIILTLGTLVFALTVAESLFGDETARLLVIAAPAWLAASVGAVPLAMLQRTLEFRRIAIIDSTSVLLGTGTAVGLAVAGVGAAALVVGGLVAMIGSATLATVWLPPTLTRPTTRALADVGAFSTPVALSSLVYATFRNVDFAILGVRLSPTNVGYYYRAYQLGVDYQSKLSQIMLRVSFPVYSRAEGMDELRRLRTRIVRTHATVIIPVLATFVSVAPTLVPWLFGSAWQPSVRPAQIMAVAGVAYAIATGTGPLMIAIGKPRALLTWSVCELAVYATMVAMLASRGLIAVSIGVAVFAVVSLLVIQVFLLQPFVGIPISQLWHDVQPGAVAGIAVLAVAMPLRSVLDDLAPSSVVILGTVLAGSVAGAAALRLLFHDVWADLVLLVRRVGPGRSAPRAA